jgi:hypothetical protein
VNKTRQAEVRAQEEVRTQDEEARQGRDPGEDRIREALETAAEVAEKTGGLGQPGRPVNRRSPFMIGLTAAFGVGVAIVPRIMGRTVQVPAIVSLVAVLIGGVLLGIVGALIAIPVAAAVRLLLQEIAFRRLDQS